MEQKCFICNSKAECTEKLLLVTCHCPKCGDYAYEKNFATAYLYYVASFKSDKAVKLTAQMKKQIKKGNVCFVDDYETSIVEGYQLLEFRDVLNLAGLELAHTNTIDSNWKD